MIAAFFDLDYTILNASSGRLFVRYLQETGTISRWQEAITWGWIALYAARLIDFPHLIAHLTAHVIGLDEAGTWSLSRRWFDEMVVGYVREGARQAIARHQADGHRVAIVTATTSYAAGPVAAHLGLGDDYLSTRLEVIDGRFSGRIVEPACYGAGKVYWVERYAAAHGIDLAQSFFYSDGASDLPLLERVGHPVAVTPDRRLRRIAQARAWPILSF